MLTVLYKLAVLLAACGAISSAGYYLLCLRGGFRFIRSAKTQEESFTPGICIFKPLDGSDPHILENLGSHCLQDYPDYEIIFGVQRSDDVAVLTIQRLMKEFPERSIRFVFCPNRLGTNRKVSMLIQMLPSAKKEYFLINDSDIRVPPDFLRRTIAPLDDPHVGLVTSLYRGIPACTLGSKLAALGTSTEFIPGVLAAEQVEGGTHFALGSCLAFHRRTLESIGGLEAIADFLADDFELGARISRAGYQIRLSPLVVEHYFPDYSFSSFLEHELRWARSTRNSRPIGYASLPLTFGLLWGFLEVILTRGAAWAWALLGVLVVFRFAMAALVGWCALRDREFLRNFWLIPLRDFLVVWVWLWSFTSREVTWRGRKYIVENRKFHPV
jgi:ceramide glucosyltransferase